MCLTVKDKFSLNKSRKFRNIDGLRVINEYTQREYLAEFSRNKLHCKRCTKLKFIEYLHNVYRIL